MIAKIAATIALVVVQAIVALPIFIVGIAITVFWGGYAISVLWEWFAVPLGLPAIGYAHAAGISLLVKVISFLPPKLPIKPPEDDEMAAMFWQALVISIGFPLMALFTGYVIRYWFM